MNFRNAKKFCCEDISLIENYEEAKNDTTHRWVTHHRLETHTSDGERRSVDLSREELKALGMYYNRPASELIFMKNSDHSKLNEGKHRTEEAKRKMAEAKKGKYTGEDSPNYGKHHSEEAKRKMSEAKKGKPSPNKGKKMSEAQKKKLSEAHKGKPSGYKGKTHTGETRRKLSEATKGMHWYNDGKMCVRAKECPVGFAPGRIK